MIINRKFIQKATFMMAVYLASLGMPGMLEGGILYKSYIIQKDQGREILCDNHIKGLRLVGE